MESTKTTSAISSKRNSSLMISELLDNSTDNGCINGICNGCEYSINVPSYLPKLIGCGIGFIVAIVIFILYLIEEKRKEKTFYFNTNYKENEEEKNERDGIAFGTNNVSYVVEQSICGTPKNMGGGFKVLEKKPKLRFAPPPPITPFSVNNNKARESRVRTVKKEESAVCQIQINADRLGRAMELVSLINDTDVPVGYTTNEEKANYALETIRGHLEKMTEEKYVLYGYLDEKQWLFNGLENTMTEFGELRLEMKLSMTSPVNLQITAFSVKSMTPNAKAAVAIAARDAPPYAPGKDLVEKISSEKKKLKSVANTNLIKSTDDNDTTNSGVKKLNSKKQVREKLQSTDKSSKKKQGYKKTVTNTIQGSVLQTQGPQSQATTRQHGTKNQNMNTLTPVPQSVSPSPQNGPQKVENAGTQKKKAKDPLKSKEENTQQLLTAAANKIMAIEKTTGSTSGSIKAINI